MSSAPRTSPTARRVGQTLQHGQRPAHLGSPSHRRGRRVRPALPPPLRRIDRSARVDRLVALGDATDASSAGTAPARQPPRRTRRRCVARLPRHRDRRIRRDAAGAHQGPPTAVQRAVDPPDPRDHRAVPEPHDQLHAHRHPAPATLDQPHHIELLITRRHAIDHRHLPVIALEHRLQHQRIAEIPACHPPTAGGRCQQPSSVSGSPSNAAKHAAESNRGNVNQSIDPSTPTSAADSMSDSSA